jgi:hypothetical protein
MIVVIVPAVMRSRQHITLRDESRMSIRLRWQSDAPPQKVLPLESPRAVSRVGRSTLDDCAAGARVRHLPANAPIPHPPFDNAPEQFRGPPPVVT